MSQIKFGLHFAHSNKITHKSSKNLEVKAEDISIFGNTLKIPSGESKPVKRALLIGINYYGTENQLEGCINDVKNVYNVLISDYHYSKENIVMLNDDPSTPDNLKPTRTNILKEMNGIISKTKSGDKVFIHYSGHGTQLTCDDGDEKDNPDTPGMDDALCPCDFDSYPDTDGFIVDNLLRKVLAENLVSGTQLRFFIDACHSFSELDLPYAYDSTKKDFIQIEPVLSNGNVLTISGCKDNQTSADAYIGNKNSGALTWALLKGLKTTLKIPTTWKELLLLARHYLADGGYEQIPMLNVGDKHLADIDIDL